MLKILFGIVIGIVLVPLVVWGWLRYGHPPVAVADPPLPQERLITHVPLNERIDREMVKTPPVQPTEENLIAGAQIYRDQCASCHGFHGKPSSFGPQMFPKAPALWEKHRNSAVVGVSDDPPGETYWKVVNGIRLSGMPSYKGVLTETEMWQVSILLANADKPLPPMALEIIKGSLGTQTPAPPAAPVKK